MSKDDGSDTSEEVLFHPPAEGMPVYTLPDADSETTEVGTIGAVELADAAADDDDAGLDVVGLVIICIPESDSATVEELPGPEEKLGMTRELEIIEVL